MRKILFIGIILSLLYNPVYAWQEPFSGWFSGVKGVMTSSTIATDDTTPSISSGNVFITSANTGATAITAFDDETVGQIIYLIGGSNTNSSTVGDSGEFNLSASFTASLDDVLILYVQAAGDFIEIGRVNN